MQKPEGKYRTVQVPLSLEEWKRFGAFCWDRGVNRGQWVRGIIMAAMKEEGRGRAKAQKA